MIKKTIIIPIIIICLVSLSLAGIIYLGIVLIDRTIIHDNDMCYGEYLGMRVEVTPCDVKHWNNNYFEQDVNFIWNGSSQKNISWIFVYDGDLESGKVAYRTANMNMISLPNLNKPNRNEPNPAKPQKNVPNQTY